MGVARKHEIESISIANSYREKIHDIAKLEKASKAMPDLFASEPLADDYLPFIE